MRVAVVHYHLGPGGVSQVIRSSLRPSSVLLVGQAPPDAHLLPLRVIEGLGYVDPGSSIDADVLLSRMRHAANEALGGPPDLWHFHNHSLGKNLALTRAAARLAAAGERVMFHLHDLAEDGRQELYRKLRRVPERFPVTPRVRYVFLNHRDYQIFLDAGLPAANAVIVPNPITASPLPKASSQSPLFFAPIRGIRRKNLGELVLLSLLAPLHARFAVSREPQNPVDKRLHDRWMLFAREFSRRIEFAVTDRIPPQEGASASFESWLRHATHIVGTSIAEGFGLPFLESAAWQRPFVGRRLSHLGHDLPHARLYDRLLVPSEWISQSVFADHLRVTLERNHRFLLKPLSQGQIDATINHLWDDAWLDFGNLPDSLQQGIIERCSDAAERQVPMIESAGVRESAADWLARIADDSSIPENLAVPQVFSATSHRAALDAIYNDLQPAPAGPLHVIDPERLLAPFLRPEAFHFLQSAPAATGRRLNRFRAIIFDVYGTLLIAPPGAVRPNPSVDPVLRSIISRFGHNPPHSPTTELAAAVARHHHQSTERYPEVDLRRLWREILGLPDEYDITPLVIATEDARVPTRLMPGAEDVVSRLVAAGVPLGLLSNAQCNTLTALGGIGELIEPYLSILSYQFGIAKPSPLLFSSLTDRLVRLGISPSDCLFIGNDPLQDIIPAAAAGFQTALFTGHPDSLRPGECRPGFVLNSWPELLGMASLNMHNS